jgi:hypothetical protein
MIFAKLVVYYTSPAHGQSSVGCMLLSNGIPLDSSETTVSRSMHVVVPAEGGGTSMNYTPATNSATIALSGAGAAGTVEVSCYRTYGVDDDGLVARNIRVDAVEVASVANG